MLSTVVLIHSSPFWHSELHPLMTSSHHLLSSCTNTRLGPPFLPEFATPIWQPSRFMNELLPTLMPPSHRQTNYTNPLAPLYASQPVLMYNILYKIWIHATVVCILLKDSYQVCASNGVVYCLTRRHLPEHSVKPTDTTSDIITATQQAPARPHISAPLLHPSSLHNYLSLHLLHQ